MDSAPLVYLPWSARDRDDFTRLASNKRVTRWIGDGRAWSRERAETEAAAALAHWSDHGFGWWAVRREGSYIGHCALSWLPWQLLPETPRRAVEVGFWLDPTLWGCGIGAQLAAFATASGQIQSRLLAARYQQPNRAARTLLYQLGFRDVGSVPAKYGGRAVTLALRGDSTVKRSEYDLAWRARPPGGGPLALVE